MKRRDFITGGFAASVSITAGNGDSSKSRTGGGMPRDSGTSVDKITQLRQGLFWIRDTCNVYLIIRGDRSLLIDCGTDTAHLDLKALGVSRIDRILLTHFHRDQCSAVNTWRGRGAQLGIPFAERRFWQEADLQRASYDIYDSYTSYYPYFGPLEDVQPDDYAYDYESLTWQDIRFRTVPLPGHTFGSVGYQFELEGTRILACGDLMSSPGKVAAYYPSQWRYMEFQGHINHMESLETVASLHPDLILPGHGEPFPYTLSAIEDLRRPLERLYELFQGKPFSYYRPVFRQLTPHVFEVGNSSSNTYILRDDTGHGLFIDCGYTSAAPISGNPHRFIDHLTPHLERELGIREVDWYVPSHYHDDHLAGYPALHARYGTKLFSSPELKDILEHPERYNMPCLLPQGFVVNQTIERGKSLDWRGIDIFVEQHPGQTLYHHLIWFRVDGKKFLAIGDNISGLCFREARDYIYSFIPKNRTPVASYGTIPRQILNHAPDVLLTGHGGAVEWNQNKVERWRNWMDEWQGLWHKVLDPSQPDEGMDPQWVEFYPFKIRIRPGQTVEFEVRITNYHDTNKACALDFRSVEGARLEPSRAKLDIPAGRVGRQSLRVKFPSAFHSHSLTVVADVTWDGRHLGEIAEAVAYW